MAGHAVKKKKAPKKVKLSTRLAAVLVILCILFGWLVVRLFTLQVVQKDNKVAAQVDQLVEEARITAPRGSIYDRNGSLLVQDSTAKEVNVVPLDCENASALAIAAASSLGLKQEAVLEKATRLEDNKVELATGVMRDKAEKLLAKTNDAFSYENGSVYVIPEKVKDAKNTANTIAVILDMKTEDVLDYLTKKENSAITLKTKVDNAVAESFVESQTTYDKDGSVKSTNGLELVEDKRRNYTNGNFASEVLGFTGDDHTGINGIEKTLNDTLAGSDGIVYYQKDADGRRIESQTKVLQEAKAGKDVTLALDSNIQSAAEKVLTETVTQWKAKSGTCIVMKTKTGEVVAMATKPDYDLNDPYTISDTFKSTHAEELTGLSNTDALETMWRNPAVSLIYEPGSTFKPITASVALEEGAINPQMTYNCTGSINVEGTTINCTGVHGTQTLAQALENSCNPAMVQIIQDVDPSLFYRYIYNYGYGQKTGVELTGEEDGIVNRVLKADNTYNLVDYSTFSFGQGLATTPIQMLTALNALVNNGYYEKPTMLKTDGSVESSGQIVSESTSKELRQELGKVVQGYSNLAQASEGYSIGGKTGTAEKFINGEYSSTKFVTSFFCFAPIEDPEYSMILLLDEPDSSAFGGTSAAPAAIEILKQALNYAGTNSSTASAPVLVPELTGRKEEEAKELLDERGISYEITQSGDGDTVIAQSIAARTAYNTGDTLTLTVGTKNAEDAQTVPDFTGMAVQAVNEKVRALGMKLKTNGSGFATAQSIAPGTAAVKDTEITVEFK